MTYGRSIALADVESESAGTVIRKPDASDAQHVWALVEATPVLDGNSLYCNLLQCTHFASTCVVAESNGEIVGWLSGYVPPEDPASLFVWQVCVAEAARGQGLGRRLVHEVLARPACEKVRRIACTITADNAQSWSLFRSIARDLDAPLRQTDQFLRDDHFGGRHDTEFGVSIGPFPPKHEAALAIA